MPETLISKAEAVVFWYDFGLPHLCLRIFYYVWVMLPIAFEIQKMSGAKWLVELFEERISRDRDAIEVSALF